MGAYQYFIFALSLIFKKEKPDFHIQILEQYKRYAYDFHLSLSDQTWVFFLQILLGITDFLKNVIHYITKKKQLLLKLFF